MEICCGYCTGDVIRFFLKVTINCFSLMSVEDDGKSTGLRVQEMSLRPSYARNFSMDNLFHFLGLWLA